jgi:prepilin-type N-terminal cleavage/methylation domain-containing protein
VKKVAKVMIWICTAPTRTDKVTSHRNAGFTLTELIVVIVIISLFLLLAMPNIFGMLGRSTFKAQIQDFVSTMQRATNAAAQSNRRYEVIIDLTQQSYMLREITSPELSQVLEEEIISESYFSQNCMVDYVMFDDYDYADEGLAKFRIGHAGWQYGGKIVLLDREDQVYSIVINRLSGIVTLERGDVELMVPKAKEDVFF